ncbi:MAG: glycosyltransferase [Gemmatimonadota bacterium]|nr:glycosyltransferase [Gemmatimonadota bacterium]
MTSQPSSVVGIDWQPLVSVIMNCYNGEKYLRQAIESVFAQTYANWEIIFWDNQSTDKSAEIVKSFESRRLKYFYAPNHTLLYEARNHAIEKASGDFIAFLDVDDWWLPTKLEKQIPLFADPQVGLACGVFWMEDERKNKRRRSHQRPVPTGWVLNDLLKSYFVGMPTLVVRRSAFDSLDHPCDPRYHVIGDFDLVVRLAMKWKLAGVHEPIACYRLHGNNESVKQLKRWTKELEQWYSEMATVEPIHSCSNLPFVKSQFLYLDAKDRILHADRMGGYRLLDRLPWGIRKLRIWMALFTPPFVLRRLT